jgi:hypothetical protein
MESVSGHGEHGVHGSQNDDVAFGFALGRSPKIDPASDPLPNPLEWHCTFMSGTCLTPSSNP